MRTSNFKKIFTENSSAYIIAEIGVNHNGDMDLARAMIDKAIECGADAVKFQAFIAENIVLEDAEKADYHKINTANEESHFQMLKKLELNKKNHILLKDYCLAKKIDFFSTPYDIDSVQMLESISIEIYKTASADLVDLLLHEKIAKTGKPVIISVGMATLDEITETLSVYKKYNSQNIALLHCVSNYPCSHQSINMKVMSKLEEQYSIPVGFSDHSIDDTASIVAVSLGAKIIEKHFTLDKLLSGPDQKASSNPMEFSKLVDEIRKTELILGNSKKALQKEELNNRLISRKSVTLIKDIKRGEAISKAILTMKRPGLGMKANMIKKIVGKKVNKDLKKNHQINLDDFE